jgi:hypothetical protein
MRTRSRVGCLYGSPTLLECLTAIAVPEIAAARSCTLCSSQRSAIPVGSAAIFTAIGGAGAGAATGISSSREARMAICSVARQSSINSPVPWTLGTASSAVVSAQPA